MSRQSSRFRDFAQGSSPCERGGYPQITTVNGYHCDELFTFLDNPHVPADNNGTERDIRSLAAGRSDGGTHRADWSAAAFARIKSVIVTGMKNQVRFIQYGIDVVRAKLRGDACRFHSPLHRTPANRSAPSQPSPRPAHPQSPLTY